MVHNIKNEMQLNVTRLPVTDILLELKDLQPQLCEALKNTKMKKEYFCYKAKYKFGDKILHNGMIYLSDINGKSISVDDNSLPDSFKNDLTYDSKVHDPLAIFLNKTSEAYYLKNNIVADSFLLQPGSVIGIPRALNPLDTRSSISNREINAGGRSLFFLAKISDRKIYQKIAKLSGIDLNVPSSYEQHWSTMVQLANKLSSDWCCEVIYFSRDFIDDLKNPEMAQINVSLNNIHTSTYDMKHNNANIWNVLYFMSIEKDNLLYKYNLNYINVIKHIFMVYANSNLGYVPTINDDMCPAKMLQSFFNESYGLINPIIMQPANFNYKNPQQLPVYLSLNYKEVMTNTLDKHGKKTNLAILSEIKYLLNVYCKDILEDKSFSDTMLFDLVEHVETIFFHSHSESSIDTEELKKILLADKRFNCDSNADNFEAIKNAMFFTGSICLTIKKTL